VFNVDGGMAAFLQTTPGQSISIQPDWAASTAVCHLMIFVTPGHDTSVYLSATRDQLGTRTDLKALSPVAEQTLGDLGVYGFSWEDNAGVQGSTYAALIDVNHMLHIGIGGSQCPLEMLLPSIETFRVN
jgi:hypothetical protein